MPAKGGAGATTIACNLAYQCKRLGAERILLADMDPLTGTVSFLLKLKSTYSFMDVLNREDSLEADLWKQMTTAVQGVDVLLAPESLVDPNAELSTAAPIVEFAQDHVPGDGARLRRSVWRMESCHSRDLLMRFFW